MDDNPDDIAESAITTLVRRAGEPLPGDLRRRIRSTIEGQLAGDLIVDTFDDASAGDVSTLPPAPARQHRWLLASAAAVAAIVGVGWVVAVGDRGEPSPMTSPGQTTADSVRRRTVSIISTDSPTGELSVALHLGTLDQPGARRRSSEFLPDGRLLLRRSTEDGEVVTLHSRWGGVVASTVLPKGTSVPGAGDPMMRDVAVGPDDVLYASYITSSTVGWDFDLVAYSFEQQPRELGRWPADWACSEDCGDVVLTREGAIIVGDGGVVPYVEPATGDPSGKQQYYVLDEVRASYEPIRTSGTGALDGTVSYGDERWTFRINGIDVAGVSAEQPLPELQPQRDGSLLGLVYGDEAAGNRLYTLWLRPGGEVQLYRLPKFMFPQEMHGILGGTSIMAVSLDTDGRYELLRLGIG